MCAHRHKGDTQEVEPLPLRGVQCPWIALSKTDPPNAVVGARLNDRCLLGVQQCREQCRVLGELLAARHGNDVASLGSPLRIIVALDRAAKGLMLPGILVYTENVGGSSPSPPTKPLKFKGFFSPL